MELPQGVTFADLADEHGQPTAIARQLMAEANSGVAVKLDRSIAPVGLPWLARDVATLQLQIDRGARSFLYELSNQLLVKPADLVQVMLVWLSGKCFADEDGRVELNSDNPDIRKLIDVAVTGKADWEDDGSETPEEYMKDWLKFLSSVWGDEFYENHMSYKLAIQPRHNHWLRKLADDRGISKAKLIANMIEALAVRDLGVELPDEPESSQE
ncbi:hypothetical protein N9C85_01640 [Synechococcus sp. AH-224-I15]|nr:hypothetical protein [Synechococcus sp. AH-224-I15]